MKADADGNPVSRKITVGTMEGNSLSGSGNNNFNSNVFLIKNTYKMKNDIIYNEHIISDACVMFFEDIICRTYSGARYQSWSFNERGTLIKIEYEKYSLWRVNESEAEKAVEYVSFDELAQYIK